jgi:hypothetical protein
MPVSVAKFTRPGSFATISAVRTQAVRKGLDAPEIGAQMLSGNHAPHITYYLISINYIGTHSALNHVRIY